MDLTYYMTYINELIGPGFPSMMGYILMGSLGLLLIVMGARLFRLWLTVTGLVTGYQTGVSLATSFELTGAAYWVLAVGFAILTALFLAFALKASFFLAGALFGGYLVWYVAALYALNIHVIFILMAAVITGYIAQRMRVPFLRLASSATGGLLLIDAILSAQRSEEPLSIIWQTIEAWRRGERLMLLLILVGCTLIGYTLQNRRAAR